ncbi:alpha/beta hydrolase fold protein [Xylogone sp. PMI_703]|nr:alpha/beta hydrolase fold protein [Xylogone sp. PMI_703]
MPSISTRFGELAYNMQGNGLPIIMLHANLHDSSDYSIIAARLLDGGYQTITLDWPLHGNSLSIAPELSRSQAIKATSFADALEDFTLALNLNQPALFIGNSVGGFAAARLAITHPERVLGLILVNTGGFVSWNPVSRLFCHILSIPTVIRFAFPYFVRKYMSPQTKEDERITNLVSTRAKTAEGSQVAALLWKSFLGPGHDLRSKAKDITAPTLLVWGARDPISPVQAGKAVQQCIPGSRLEIIDAGHVVFSSKPEEFLALVEDFVKSTKS